ncbi:hypothetical protein CHGG_09971 [Chaetomium globosum CBS 148.51]|uniref:Uncharacterized protein n=1 Tax=Chaetomium globosum (strain ATCC 6205 / CBS 148.51 / DSM 1962 / NBRC 6347 / NRRL 1970) TaxID=306901 RepID=Q2GPY3_CHAGB|nr:uncharacterized protein CHGG_09971 [Chaetomium globosum CBS 148.51]EAQ83567.1 hypothetical protein CHGG_09971 [Chaetomium globosum CBS 148.51]
MSVNPGTLRGTPSRNQGRGAVPFANNNSPAGPSSAIPRPVLETPPAAASEVGGSSLSTSRQKQTKRDEAIRRKLENDLSKKKHLTGRARQSRKAPPGTVLALKPSQALQIKPQTTVAEAAQLMAAKREDCVLVTDDDDRIAGIFTAKDLAFRVVGAGLKPNNVTIAEIMTKNPLCARTDTSATDALDLMVRKGFRHLPVMDENQDISGVLDITKCFYDAMEKLERAYSSSRRLYDALEGVQSELGTSQPQQIIQYVEALRSKMSGPTLESVLNGTPPTTVSVRTSVKEAAQMMKENHTTAILVTDQGAITGIFTSKDVVLRVIAPGLDPATCSVVRVMTPHPDFAPMDMSIQAALRKMHDGHYLNLPVMNDGGEIVGMVDVLKLTYATLEQINTMGTGDNEGPAWNKFWLSLDHETESMVSGDGSLHHTNPGPRSLMSPDMGRSDRLVSDSVAPGDSASHVGADSPHHSAVGIHTPELPPSEVPFPFKFKAPSGRVHRLQVTAAHGMAEFVANVTSKLGAEVDAIGGAPVVEDNTLSGGYALSYLDNEGDSVSITTDEDLLEAILLARRGHRDKVDLFVHDPSEPPVPSARVPAPESTVLATPPASSTHRERRKTIEDEEEDSDESEDEDVPARRGRHGRTRTAPPQQIAEQLVAGVPNELLLPGAIAMLAVVIAGVFTVSRLSTLSNALKASISRMILRNFGVRHGRQALAAPVSRSCLRTISSSATRSTTAPTTVAEPTTTASAPTTATHAFAAAQAAARQAELARIPENYTDYMHQREHTRGIGSRVESRYHPDQMLEDPPRDATLEMLMAAQVHMGHHISQWNPANQRYIYGQRAGIHIISLETTATHLRRAARVVEEVAYYGGLILFVGTRKEHMPVVVRAAELAQGYHLFQKWTPGAITNRDIILASGELKIVDGQDKVLDGFETHLRDRRPVVPDLVVCLNPLENYPLLHECGVANIPTIGLIDTDADPTWVTYQIPANDDSLRSVTLLAGVLGRAGERGQQRRLADADDGVISWRSPRDVETFMEKDALAKAEEELRQIIKARKEGILDDKPATEEDFMSDDELLRALNDGPIPRPPQ